jgi:acyl-CoA thioesterase
VAHHINGLYPSSVPEHDARTRLRESLDVLDEAQCQRLLAWAGSISRNVPDARAPQSSIGPLADMLHITNKGSSGGVATYQLDVVPELLNPHGVLHGGAVYTMIDYSMGGATMSVLQENEICATIEIKVSYLAGVRAGVLTCDTQVIKQGRSVVFLESKVRDETGKRVAAASGSFAVIRQG